MGIDISGWGPIMVNIIGQRLPRSTLDAWEQRRIAMEDPQLSDLQLFLESKARGRRVMEDRSGLVEREPSREPRRRDEQRGYNRDARARPYPDTRNSSSAQYRPSRNNVNDEQTGPQFRPFYAPSNEKCPMEGCQEIHPVFKCGEFLRNPLEARREVVRRANLCRCCLLPGHRAADCTFPPCRSCPEDHDRHSFRLCPKSTKRANEQGPHGASNMNRTQ